MGLLWQSDSQADFSAAIAAISSANAARYFQAWASPASSELHSMNGTVMSSVMSGSPPDTSEHLRRLI